MQIFKTALVFLIVVCVFGGGVAPLSVSAQSGTISATSLIQQLETQIKELQARLEALKKAQTEAQQAVQSVDKTFELISNLREGMSGDDVKLLQAVLGADSDVYPEGVVSGYFGALTAKAVKKFQKKYGFDQVGFVGPKTLRKLNELMREYSVALEDDDEDDDDKDDKDDRKKEKKVCLRVPPGHLIAPGWLKKNGGVRPVVLPCQKLPPGIWKKLPPVATTTPPTSTSTPDIAAPIISALLVSGVSVSGASISWATNEAANSKVYYGTSSPVVPSSATVISSSSLVTSRLLTLSGLNASTTYYFVVTSADAALNVVTSTESSFTTLTPADVTAPVISGVGHSLLTSSSAMIGWGTDEAATSKVYFGTSTPLNFLTVQSVSSATLVTTHSLPLIGLSASTTYYYTVTSQDASLNTATSTEFVVSTL